MNGNTDNTDTDYDYIDNNDDDDIEYTDDTDNNTVMKQQYKGMLLMIMLTTGREERDVESEESHGVSEFRPRGRAALLGCDVLSCDVLIELY